MAKFDLKKDSAKLAKYSCWLGAQKGHFYVTTYDVCFLGALGKKVKLDLVRCDTRYVTLRYGSSSSTWCVVTHATLCYVTLRFVTLRMLRSCNTRQ